MVMGLLKVMERLIFLLLLFVLVDLEVAQLVALLGVRHDPQPVPEVVLLQVLLGQILQVPARNTNRGKTSRDVNHLNSQPMVTESVRHSLRFVVGISCQRKDITYAVLKG